MQQALQTVGAALAPLEARQTVTGITDWGEDDIAVWRSIWEQEERGGCCIAYTERHVAYQGEEGTWQTGAMELARAGVSGMAEAAQVAAGADGAVGVSTAPAVCHERAAGGEKRSSGRRI